MTKRDALKLRHGDVICYGDNPLTAKHNTFRWGRVLHVTPKGGIRVACYGAGDDAPPSMERSIGFDWVPYHHVSRKESL
jgi:hypothetical protein